MTDQRRKLLVVEDDPGLQSQLRWCFNDYEVLVAEDRETALAQLRRHEPPVVLQDLGLPPDAEGKVKPVIDKFTKDGGEAMAAEMMAEINKVRARR